VKYRYMVIPRNKEGQEQTPSPIVDINTKQLENLINDGQDHHEDGNNQGGIPEGNGNGNSGQLPPDTGNGDQTNGQPTDGQGNSGDQGNQSNQGNSNGGEAPPPDIGNSTGNQPGPGGIELPPPPEDGSQQPFPEGTNG